MFFPDFSFDFARKYGIICSFKQVHIGGRGEGVLSVSRTATKTEGDKQS
jgi:hypothetical protein